MPTLSQRDLRRLLELVADSHAHRDLGSLCAALLPGLRGLVPCDIASYNEVEPGARRAISLLDPAEAMIPDGEAILARHAAEHPLIAHYQRTRDGRARKLSDFVDRRALHRLGIYREAYRAMGVEYQIAVTLPSRPELTIGIALSRGARDFGERDRDLLNAARPHLVQAHRNVAAYAELRARLEALERGAEESPAGIAVLDRLGGIELLTGPARRQLERRFGPLSGARLPAPLEDWIAGLARAPAALQPLVLDGDEPLLARFLPAGGPDERDVLVLEPGARAPTTATLMALGLTRREAEVLRLVALGSANGKIAATLSVSPRTVQKHLEHVYAKLGVSTRAAAAATAWAGAELGR